MKTRLDYLLDKLAPVVRTEMLRRFDPDCCIATAAVLKRVFRYYDMEAHAIPAQVVISNPVAAEFARRGLPEPEMRDTKLWRDIVGFYRLAITPASAMIMSAQEPGFGGHVIVLVRGILIDASLDQASRPRWKITIPSFLHFEATPEFLHHGAKMVVAANDCAIEYSRLADQSFKSAPDWTDAGRHESVFRAIVGRVGKHQVAA
jgi:hypothetical protein